jgi:hypothetical protein
MFYENVLRMLQKKNVRHAVAGGVALVLHGVVRFTADLDLIVDLEQENLRRFIQAMNELGYRPRNPVQAEDFLDSANRDRWKREKGMEVFSFVDPAQPMTLVDIFIEEKIPFHEIEKDLVRISAKGITIPVVSARHLKRLKRAAGRPQDLADIEALEALEKAREGKR